MRAMPWDVVVLDERQASKSFATKMYPVLHDLGPRQRLSMRDSPADAGPEQLLAWASFLEPNGLKVRAAACCAPHTAAQAIAFPSGAELLRQRLRALRLNEPGCPARK